MDPLNIRYSSGSVSAQLKGYPTAGELDKILEWCKGWIPVSARIGRFAIESNGPDVYSFQAFWQGSES